MPGNPEQTLQRLRHLMGYIENATDSSVKLFQDDATRTFHIQVGQDSQYGGSLEEVIDKAYEAMAKDEQGYPV